MGTKAFGSRGGGAWVEGKMGASHGGEMVVIGWVVLVAYGNVEDG